MAHKRKHGSVWEYTFKKAGLLDKPIILTFKNEEEGDGYAKNLQALLDRGIIPTEHQVVQRILNVDSLISMYLRDAHVKPKDAAVLGVLRKSIGKTALLGLNSKWVDDWISDMKRVDVLAPATIRSKVGALARCTDWGVRKGLLLLPDHPLRTLPNGYASYTKLDAAVAGKSRTDIERDRRLEPGEFERIVAVIESGMLPRAQRPYQLPDAQALRVLFVLALESAMRLREMYTLTIDQVDLAKMTIFLDRTKNGDRRQVPLTSVSKQALQAYLLVRKVPEGHLASALFPWWNGDTSQRYLRDRSDFLSKLFISIFTTAGCLDLKFHDLRHTAVCHLYERTTLTDLQISKISGHRSLVVLRRYANLRGSDLSGRLWIYILTCIPFGLLGLSNETLVNVAGI